MGLGRQPPTGHPVHAYIRLMDEVKARLGIVESLAGRPVLEEPFTDEIAALQLRCILELIAFASLSGDRGACADAYTHFQTHADATRLLRDLEAIHPAFYPQPKAAAPLVLTREKFVELYDQASQLLHARNPFDERDRSPLDIGKWLGLIRGLLSIHLARLAGRPEVWLIRLTVPPEGHVHATLTEAPRHDGHAGAPDDSSTFF